MILRGINSLSIVFITKSVILSIILTIHINELDLNLNKNELLFYTSYFAIILQIICQQEMFNTFLIKLL